MILLKKYSLSSVWVSNSEHHYSGRFLGIPALRGYLLGVFSTLSIIIIFRLYSVFGISTSILLFNFPPNVLIELLPCSNSSFTELDL